MADVRSLLRAERAARAPPKTRKQVPAPSSPPRPNKKRKADDSNPTIPDKRIRTKAKVPTNLPSGFFDGAEEESENEDADEDDEEEQDPEQDQPLAGFLPATEAQPSLPQSTSLPPKDPPSKDLDDEWAAFEQDIASLPTETDAQVSALDALNAHAILQAAPTTAQEADAQAHSLLDPPTAQKQRDREIEEEKEDAERALEEEFETMEVLEERLRRLKEKRERLRTGKVNMEDVDSVVVENGVGKGEGEASDGEDEDDEGDEWDGWRFGAS